MALTIITTRSDNGNKFLCPDCVHCFHRSGTKTEDQFICGLTKLPVPFVITQCTHFLNKCFDQDTIPVEMMKKSAWEMQVVKGRLTFTPPEHKRRRRLFTIRSRRNPGKASAPSNPAIN